MLRETYRWTAAALLALVLVAGCSDSKKKASPKPKIDLLASYRYDATRPFALKTKRTERTSGVEIRDISFTGPRGERVIGYLVVPPGKRRHPAVIYAHGAGGDRIELLEQAIAMSLRGAVALTFELPYSQRRSLKLRNGIQGVEEQVDHDVLAVQEVRRAADLLRSFRFVDGDRIGYVGWSAGARIGAITAGVDHRIRSFDLIAGGAVPLSVYAAVAPKDVSDKVLPILAKTDALFWIRRSAPSAVFFQNGRFDRVVANRALRQLAHDGSEPKDIRWYQTGHVPGERAWRDSRDWLSGRFGLTRQSS